jgi:hypothetical protein
MLLGHIWVLSFTASSLVLKATSTVHDHLVFSASYRWIWNIWSFQQELISALRLCHFFKLLAKSKDSRLLIAWLRLLSACWTLLQRWLLSVLCYNIERDERVLVPPPATWRLFTWCRVFDTVEMLLEPGLYACLRFGLISCSLGGLIVKEDEEVFLDLRSFFFFLSVNDYRVDFRFFPLWECVCYFSFFFLSRSSCAMLDWVLWRTPELSHMYLPRLIGYRLCISSFFYWLMIWEHNFVIWLHCIGLNLVWIDGLDHPRQLLAKQLNFSSFRSSVSPVACRMSSTFGWNIILL